MRDETGFSQGEHYVSARADAIAYIGFSLKPSGKVYMHLKRRGYDADLCEKVVACLVGDGYINDHRVCVQMAKTRSGKRCESARRFFDRLIQAGVPRDVASDFLSEYAQDRQSIEELINNKYESDEFFYSSDQDLITRKIKMTRFLQSRGYSAGLVDEALSRRFNRVE